MKIKQAFTLVELIVVITILAILGTIGFINLQGFSSSSRDSKRISELSEIRNGLQIYQAKNGILPSPSEQSVTIGSGTNDLIIQGYAGVSVLNEIRMNGDSKDPLDDNKYYTYSVNANKTKFQLLGLLENDDNLTSFNNLNIIPTTYASYENRHPYIIGNIVGIFLEETTNTPINELQSGTIDLNTDTNNYKVVFLDEALTSSGTELYNDIINKTENQGIVQTEEPIYSCITQPSYTNANFTVGEPNQENQTWQNTNNTGACYYECTLGYTGNECNNTLTSCKNILDLGLSTGNGIYKIDPENTGTPFDAYCDMESNGGGWTLMVASGMGFGKNSLFWDGTLNSNNNFTFTGNTLNTGNAEKIIKNLSFTDTMFNFDGENIYRSATTSTFKNKKDNLTPWSNISGNLGNMVWNHNDTEGYTNGNFLLGIIGGDAGYTDYHHYFIGGTSFPSSNGTYYGTQFIEFNNTITCSNAEWCLYGAYTSNYGIGRNYHRFVYGSKPIIIGNVSTESFSMFIR